MNDKEIDVEGIKVADRLTEERVREILSKENLCFSEEAKEWLWNEMYSDFLNAHLKKINIALDKWIAWLDWSTIGEPFKKVEIRPSDQSPPNNCLASIRSEEFEVKFNDKM